MTEKLKQIAKEEIAKLPKESQEAINSFDWAATSEAIGKKYLLRETEVNDLQTETLLVLIGLEYLDLYAQNVEDNLGTSTEEAKKIADEALERIFTPISNIIEENIKKNLKDKNPNPEQTLNFILSGGDYAAFIEQKENQVPETPTTNKIPVTQINPPTLADIKSNLEKSNI